MQWVQERLAPEGHINRRVLHDEITAALEELQSAASAAPLTGETPRTDEVLRKGAGVDFEGAYDWLSDHARQLERELADVVHIADRCDFPACEKRASALSATPDIFKAALRDIVAPFDLLNPSLTPRPAEVVMLEVAEAIKKHSAIVALIAPADGGKQTP